MGATPEELELVRRCVAGDEDAWEALYEQVLPAVRASAARACARWGQPGAADDVVSDLFAHLLANERRALAGFAGRSRLESWLRVLTRRRANRLLRGRRPGALGEGYDAPAEGRTPSDEAVLSEDQAALRAQLAELAPRDRLALQLFYEGGKSYQEVAEALDLPANRIGTLLARARARLAKRLRG